MGGETSSMEEKLQNGEKIEKLNPEDIELVQDIGI